MLIRLTFRFGNDTMHTRLANIMNMNEEKVLMSEAATLYYEKKLTQQEIAALMSLSRQTVSRLLSDAVKENIVEIKVHNPRKDCDTLQSQICEKFGIDTCVVCGVSNKNDSLRRLMTVKAAVEYIVPILKKGGQNIALSWGRTVQEFIEQLPDIHAGDNVIFPLFGATDNENLYFSPNELARCMADKIGASVKYAWFPYMADSNEDCKLLKTLSYYKKMQALWRSADITIVGIGNTDVLGIFGKTFGYSEKHTQVIGDVATHFFNEKGEFVNLYQNTLCASADNIKSSKQTIAIACGDAKVQAIGGALRTKLIDTLIVDEYTAKKIREQNT